MSLFPCPRCNAPITEDEYIGANFQISPPSQFYHCKNCGEIIKKPIEKKVKA